MISNMPTVTVLQSILNGKLQVHYEVIILNSANNKYIQ